MLKTHLPNILTYLTHRITNATAEGLNSKIPSTLAKSDPLPLTRSGPREDHDCGGDR
jgi:hypothetical protein